MQYSTFKRSLVCKSADQILLWDFESSLAIVGCFQQKDTAVCSVPSQLPIGYIQCSLRFNFQPRQLFGWSFDYQVTPATFRRCLLSHLQCTSFAVVKRTTSSFSLIQWFYAKSRGSKILNRFTFKRDFVKKVMYECKRFSVITLLKEFPNKN